MRIYNYVQDTKEFTTSSTAIENPLEKGKYLIPANATAKEPLISKEGFAVCFNEVKNEWEYIEDNRGKTIYSTTDKTESKVDYLGIIKDGFTLLKPKETDTWDGTKWVTDKELLRTKTLTNIQTTYQTASTKNITYKNVVYKGGESSASAIAGAVTLAQSLEETDVKIIALDDSENFMSFSEAMQLSGMIAKSWRDAFFRYKELKRAALAARNVEELELIKW